MATWEPDREKVGDASTKEVADAIKASREAAEDPGDEASQRAVDIVKEKFGK